jgi:hypothetical protein
MDSCNDKIRRPCKFKCITPQDPFLEPGGAGTRVHRKKIADHAQLPGRTACRPETSRQMRTMVSFSIANRYTPCAFALECGNHKPQCLAYNEPSIQMHTWRLKKPQPNGIKFLPGRHPIFDALEGHRLRPSSFPRRLAKMDLR